MLLEIDDPIAGERVFAKSPFRMTKVKEVPALTAPELGQHTESVLGEVLQYDEQKIQELRKEQII
jgi:CoA:oxalate CoA-transferase